VWQQHPFLNSSNAQPKPQIGISACLYGDNVRYDGRSKGLPALITALEPYLHLQKICPEVAIGMGTPRDPIKLCKDTGHVRAVGIKNPEYDVTEALKEYAKELIPSTSITTASDTLLCGYIFKSRSPSCGVGSTPIHENNIPTGFGDGIYSQQIQLQLPWLPVAEEQDLVNSHQQQHFILLTQLVALFFKNQEKNSLHILHIRIKKLRALLPQTSQHQLTKLTRDAKSSETTSYLTLLIKELQRLPYQVIKPAL